MKNSFLCFTFSSISLLFSLHKIVYIPLHYWHVYLFRNMHFHHCEIILFDHMYRKRKSSVHVNDLKTSFFEFESFSLSSDWMIIQLVLCMIVQYLKIQYRCQLVFMTVKYKDSQGPLSKAHKKKKGSITLVLNT